MTRSVSLETSWNFGWWHSSEFIQGVFLNNPLQNLDDLSLMFVAGLRSHTRGEQHQANSDGVANPLIKLINSRQVTRRRYGRQVNSNVGLETGVGWRYLARIRAITRDYTKFVVGTHVGTHVLLYACTIINTCLFPDLSSRNVNLSICSMYCFYTKAKNIFLHTFNMVKYQHAELC